MKFVNQSYYNKRIVIFSAFVFSFFILGIYSWISANDTMYLINENIAFDDSLFPNSILRFGNSVSAKYLSDALSGLLRNYMDWHQIRLITYFLVVVVFSIAFINFSIRFDMNNIIISVVLMAGMSIQGISGNLGIYTTYMLEGNYEKLGAAIGVLAISFCFEKPKYNVAFILAGLSCVFHIHEGMYSGTFVFILWVAKQIESRKRLREIEFKELLLGLILWFIAILISVIPPIITNKLIYSSKEYIDSFIFKRLATHIMPYNWGNFNIFIQYLTWGTIIAFIFLYGNKVKNQLDMRRKYVFYAISGLASCTAVILLSIFFIDLIPVRFFANLFMSKFFKYVGFLFTAMLSGTIDDILNEKAYYNFIIGIVIMILLPLSQWTILVLLPATVLYIFLKIVKNHKIETGIQVQDMAILTVIFICIWVLIHFYIKNNNITITYDFNKAVFWGIILVSGFAVQWILSNPAVLGKYIPVTIAGILLINSWYYASKIMYNKEDRSLSLKDYEYYIERAATADIVTLADYLKDNSEKDVLVLANPYDFRNSLRASWFQVLSLRNVYVTDKVLVYTDMGVKEWNNRLNKLSNWENFTADDFYNTMKEIGSEYILLSQEEKQKAQESTLLRCAYDTPTYALYEIN